MTLPNVLVVALYNEASKGDGAASVVDVDVQIASGDLERTLPKMRLEIIKMNLILTSIMKISQLLEF